MGSASFLLRILLHCLVFLPRGAELNVLVISDRSNFDLPAESAKDGVIGFVNCFLQRRELILPSARFLAALFALWSVLLDFRVDMFELLAETGESKAGRILRSVPIRKQLARTYEVILGDGVLGIETGEILEE